MEVRIPSPRKIRITYLARKEHHERVDAEYPSMGSSCTYVLQEREEGLGVGEMVPQIATMGEAADSCCTGMEDTDAKPWLQN